MSDIVRVRDSRCNGVVSTGLGDPHIGIFNSGTVIGFHIEIDGSQWKDPVPCQVSSDFALVNGM